MAGRHRARFTLAAKIAGAVTAAGVVIGTAAALAGSSAAAPDPAVSTAGGASPYLDVTLRSDMDLVKTAQQSGVKSFNLAFVVSAGQGCAPKWGGQQDLDQNPIVKQVDAFRAAGGDVRLSFGGATGTELAAGCTNADQLAGAYQQAIKTVGAKKVDFDIEGGALGDAAANGRRNDAIKKLQSQNPGLDVSFTLPVLPSGLTQPGVDLVQGAKTAGVKVNAVNIMAMDYGDGPAPNPRGKMGKYAIDAATATQQQVKGALGLNDADAWATIAITPMIGQNDQASEVFSTDDAKKVADFAKSKHLAWLSQWSATRDKACPGGGGQAQATCSGVDQQPGEFAKILNGG